MEKKANQRNADTDPTDFRKVTEWLAQAGVTVDLVEDKPAHACSVCRPRDLHVAA